MTTTEKHVRYVAEVDTLPEAWAFIMAHVDEFRAPSIAIEAFARYSTSLLNGLTVDTLGYTASIHGNVQC